MGKVVWVCELEINRTIRFDVERDHLSLAIHVDGWQPFHVANAHFVEGVRVLKTHVDNYQWRRVKAVNDLRVDHSRGRDLVRPLNVEFRKMLVKNGSDDALQ